MRVIDHTACSLFIGEHGLEVIYQGQKVKGIEAIIPRIGSSVTRTGTMVLRHFERQGIYTATQSQSILQCRNKWECYQILASNDIRVPKSLLPAYEGLSGQFIESQFGDKSVIKLLESTHGLGVILSESTNNAVATMEAFQRLKQKSIIQEFIAEAKGSDVRAFVVNGEVVAAMQRQALNGEFRSNLHRGATASSIELSPEEKNIAQKVCQLLKLNVAGVDILRSNKGPMILEVNASPGLEGIEYYTKVDVAKRIIQFVESGYRKWKSRKGS